MINPLEKATHMLFAENETGVYAAGWDVPEWNTQKEFYKENRGSTIYRLHRDDVKCVELIKRFKEYKP